MKLIKLAFFVLPFFTAVSAIAVAEPGKSIYNSPTVTSLSNNHSAALTFEAKVKKDADAASTVEVRREFAEEGNLQKRACKNNGCTCAKGTAQGQYCGYCNAVTGKGSAALFPLVDTWSSTASWPRSDNVYVRNTNSIVGFSSEYHIHSE